MYQGKIIKMPWNEGGGEGGLGHSLAIIKWTWGPSPHPHLVTFRYRRAHLRIYVGKKQSKAAI